MAASTKAREQLEEVTGEYRHGFATEIETDFAPKGLSEDVIRFISSRKNEPDWLLDWRLKAYRAWQKMEEPTWAHVRYTPIDYQDIYFYAAPKTQ